MTSTIDITDIKYINYPVERTPLIAPSALLGSLVAPRNMIEITILQSKLPCSVHVDRPLHWADLQYQHPQRVWLLLPGQIPDQLLTDPRLLH